MNEKHATEINAVLADLAGTKKEIASEFKRNEDFTAKIQAQEKELRKKEDELLIHLRDLEKHALRIRELEEQQVKLLEKIAELEGEVAEARAMVSARVDGESLLSFRYQISLGAWCALFLLLKSNLPETFICLLTKLQKPSWWQRPSSYRLFTARRLPSSSKSTSLRSRTWRPG